MSRKVVVSHVTPKNDMYLHVLDADGECWCRPLRDDDDPDDILFVHQSYDRREDYEDGLRKPH